MSQAVMRLLAALTANKGADVLVSPKTILPSLVLGIGLAPWVVAWLVPIREAFALIPQGFLSVYLRRHPNRYKTWRLGMLLQIAAMSAILMTSFLTYQDLIGRSQVDKALIGFVILAFLLVFSVGRSCCSLTFKDIQADTVSKGHRGDLIGRASMLSGLITLIIAAPIVWFQQAQTTTAVMLIVLTAISFFTVTLLLMWPVKTVVANEQSTQSTDYHAHWWQNIIPDLDNEAWVFIAVRSVFVHSALVAPYFMLTSQFEAKQLMAYYLAAEALAALLSAKIWGRLADRSARSTLRLAGIMAIIACVGLMWLVPDSLWLSALLFFLLSVAHTGVRTARKTYTLDIKTGQERTELVGSANSLIGVVLILLGSLYAVMQTQIGENVVWVMTAMLAVGVVSTFLLAPEKE
ncbi:MFS transporter [Alteromonas oceanisediminis]|uniref:MFS transporter n=1 Tax=Alteromonas oceanisediminis TaxID=2836180 RepID=UPI001BD92562|nr:MFS transporter [Alteromonas oceanisediminis]MBT0587244.1 MFS transporter [Alteromonas oceanisediminis]